MEVLTSILNFFDTVLWSSPLIYISIFVGLLYTVGLKGFQIRYLKQMVNSVFEKSADSESSTSFEAFALTVAARVGTGNIVGVATAIAAGGPGAVFWMWVMAILGAATSFAENTLAQVYKEKVDGMYRGGTSFFVKKGLGLGWFGTVFAFCSLLNCGILHTTQPNSIADAMYNAFGVSLDCGSYHGNYSRNYHFRWLKKYYSIYIKDCTDHVPSVPGSYFNCTWR